MIFFRCILTPFDFPHSNMPLQINITNAGIEYSKKPKFVPVFCMNKYCIPTATAISGKSFSLSFYQKPFKRTSKEPNYVYISNYSIAIPYETKEDFEQNIKDMYFISGEKRFYFSRDEILKFEKERKNTDIYLDTMGKSQTLDCMIYHLPKTLPSNFNGLRNLFLSWFLALFSNNCIAFWPAFIGFLICAIIYYLNRELFDFKIKKEHFGTILICIFMLATVLRFVTASDTRLFIDELYTKYIATSDFLSCFSDPGNPPLFFISEYIMSKIFGGSVIAYKIIPFVCSLIFIYFVYAVFKKINKPFALLMTFLASVNTIVISNSTILRSTSMCIMLSAVTAYCFLNYMNTKSNKDLIYYFLSALLSINTHYFLLFYVAVNFVWGSFGLFKNKNEFKKFVTANIACFLSFLPFLLLTFKSAIGKDFNSYISKLNMANISDIIVTFFSNKIVFFIFVLVFIFMIISSLLSKELAEKYNIKTDENAKNLFLYLSFSVIFTVLLGALISYFIKPVMDSKILFSLYGLFFMLFGSVLYTIFDLDLNNKKIYCTKLLYSLILIFLFSYTANQPESKISKNFDNYMFYVEKNSKEYIDKGYEIRAYIEYDNKLLNNYPDLKNIKDIKWIPMNTNNISSYVKQLSQLHDEIIEDSKSGKKIVLYITSDYMVRTFLNDRYKELVSFHRGNIVKVVFN